MAFLVLFEVPQHHGGHDDIAVLWRDAYSLVSIFRAEVKSSMPRFRPLRSSLGPEDPRRAMIHCDICICKFPWINFCRILPPWAFTERILGLHRAPCQEWHAVPELPWARGGHCQYVPTFFVLNPWIDIKAIQGICACCFISGTPGGLKNMK